jgi:uncharacterized protein YpuA (DUF1002 family)
MMVHTRSGTKILLITVLLLVFLTIPAKTAQKAVVTWGADLSAQDKAKVVRLMGIQPSKEPLRELSVTNTEEHALLGETVPPQYLGTRALSSAYVRPLQAGSGLQVSTHNITWVSRRVFAQALVTGGVRDAQVIVAAPVPVSGTAALTGIFKAFEAAVDEELPEQAKRIAGQELYITKEVGESIGHEKASRLMEKLKEDVVRRNLSDKAEITQLIYRLEAELGIKLSDADREKLADLMAKIRQLNLRLDDMEMQLNQVSDRVDRLLSTETGLKGTVRTWLQRLLDLITRLLDQFLSFVAGARSSFRSVLPGNLVTIGEHSLSRI